ncbi:MAG: 4-hydroxyphenylacetate 3-hydroxylase [Thermoplasmatales archaeon B_DKE]|nr:MAG: 4-hydroxyphenylacetate 3-hydroxylase [Thermoplasmatales archaeon B_DKE]OWP57391.1 MAG: 4-hydroxyphenylacetate 3-hydroxylase [Thermoplasmatales archaeon B_DKE]
MRNGNDYLDSLGKREVYINGEKVSDVRKSPSFKGILGTLKKLYDFSYDPENHMQFTTEWGTRGNIIYNIPKSYEDMRQRHEAIKAWAQITMGFVGRSPDHVGSFLAGFAANSSVFDRDKRKFSSNVIRHYRNLVDTDVYFSYAIIPPQVDRSKKAHELPDKRIQVSVVEEREDGIVVRGSQMLATGAAVADVLFVSCIPPLSEGDEDYALSFVVPVGAKGLKLYCRSPYETGKSSVFDYPMSTRFDESDATVVFDDVFIPWEDIFAYRDVKLLQAQFFETPAHIYGNNQAQVRLAVKLRFISGLAASVSRMNGTDRIQGVLERLGELASLASIVEGMALASETTGSVMDRGYFVPNPRFLYGPMGLQAEIYPRAIGILRELSGAGVLQLPSTINELNNPETMKDLSKYIRSTDFDTVSRTKLFKLVWDVIGSEFAGRHLQYEMFYAGAPYVSRMYAYRNFDYQSATDAVKKFMSEYGLEDEHLDEPSKINPKEIR